MRRDPDHVPVPKSVLWSAFGLIVCSLALTALAQATGLGTVHTPEASPMSSVQLQFDDREDGAVVVREATTGREIEVIDSGSGGFVRGVLRGMARERRLERLDTSLPFRLTRWSDGRLSIRDTATERTVELDAFGPTNAQAFAVLLEVGRRTLTDGD